MLNIRPYWVIKHGNVWLGTFAHLVHCTQDECRQDHIRPDYYTSTTVTCMITTACMQLLNRDHACLTEIYVSDQSAYAMRWYYPDL